MHCKIMLWHSARATRMQSLMGTLTQPGGQDQGRLPGGGDGVLEDEEDLSKSKSGE